MRPASIATSFAVAAYCLLLPMSGTSAPFAYIPASSDNSVIVLDLATYTSVASIPVGIFPEGVAFSSDAKTVYVANFSSNSVSVIDTTSNAVVATIPVGVNPRLVAINNISTRFATDSCVDIVPVGPSASISGAGLLDLRAFSPAM